MSLLDYRLFTEVTVMRDVKTLSLDAISCYQFLSAGTYVINGMECRGANSLQHSFTVFSLQHSATLSVERRVIKRSNNDGLKHKFCIANTVKRFQENSFK
jgi:hypothetical protein